MFWQRFYDLCVCRGTKPNPVAKEIGISSGILTKWKTQNVLPNGETLKKIADYLNCSVDYLLGRSDDKIDDEMLDTINSIPCYILEIYSNLYEAKKAFKVIQKIRFHMFKSLFSSEEMDKYKHILLYSPEDYEDFIIKLENKYKISSGWLDGENVPMFSNDLLKLNYAKLNSLGRKKAEEYISDLVENSKYTPTDQEHGAEE